MNATPIFKKLVNVLAVCALMSAFTTQTPTYAAVSFEEEPPPITETGESTFAPAENQSADQANARAPSSPRAVSASLSYYKVAGSTFQPRGSSSTYAYGGQGCVRRTAGSDALTVNLNLPDNAIIKYVRLYTSNPAATDTSTAYITSYDGIGGLDNLVGVSSAAGTGFKNILSAQITHTVDTNANSYVLNWFPGSVNAELCGMRVAYYAPSLFGTFVSNVHKN